MNGNRYRKGMLASLAVVVAMLTLLVIPIPARADNAGWQGEYFSNPYLSGTPTLVRTDGSINFDWGNGSPDWRIPADGFSVRWTRTVHFDQGRYRFTAETDDGVRLYLNGVAIIDQWRDQAPTAHSTEIELSSGSYTVMMEYYENTGGAVARLNWQRVGGPGITEWRGEYFNNMSLSGSPAVVRNDSAVNFDWGEGSPDPRISADGFSVRWTRTVYLEGGRYRFTARHDDGLRLYVDNSLLIDAWYDQSATTHVGERQLATGNHTIKVEYYENRGDAVAQLSWQRVSTGEPPITEWRGEYFTNMSLSGSPVVVRNDSAVNFDWGSGSPDPRVPADGFSARWTRTVYLSGGVYRFSVRSDDGIRLYVDGTLVIDSWRDRPPTTDIVDRQLGAGNHEIKLEYYEHTGTAMVQLSWSLRTPGGQPTTTWRGEYFNNRHLSGTPVVVRNDSAIDFDWGHGSPDPRIRADGFSARWTRVVNFEPGRYQFSVRADDGVRLYVDGDLVINEWHDSSPTTYRATRSLSGNHAITLEYYENAGSALVELSWSRAELPSGGNLVTCVGTGYSWVKVYQRTAEGGWLDINPNGWGALDGSGFLKIDGLPVDYYRYGAEGHPYKVELYVNGQLVQSVGNTDIGQPVFRIRPDADNFTPWGCPIG